MNQSLVNPKDYHYTVKKLRAFFEDAGFIEVHTQSRLSILAACEDPRTVSTFNYAGNVWPLPQTGQMWLEYELLKNPEHKGLFCISTSFRNEPNPIPGRHDLVFPMFEFETHGNMSALEQLERKLLEYLGFGKAGLFPGEEYRFIADHYGTKEITAPYETKIGEDYGNVFFLRQFPQYTSPFWNMKKNGDYANKIDVIMCGIETIGSAERSCNVDEMRDLFHTISSGMYADILYGQFGRDRVEKELEDFLALPMFPRCGGGIGVTRIIKALKKIHQL